MIREVAIDPGLIIELSKRYNSGWARLLIDKFGIDKGVLKSKYPSAYPRELHQEINNKNLNDIEKTAAIELYNQLKQNQIKRKNTNWDPKKDWFSNSIQEHSSRTFSDILVNKDIIRSGINEVIDFDDEKNGVSTNLDRLNNDFQSRIPRNNDDLVTQLVASFYFAKKMIIVDSYFDPFKNEFNNPLIELILGLIDNKNQPDYPEIIIIKNEKDGRQIEQALNNNLSGRIPNGVTVKFFVYQEKVGKEEFHDRYIITDLAGLRIDPGFARTSDPNSTDKYTVNLMDSIQYADFMNIYIDNPELNFEVKEEYDVTPNHVNKIR